MTTAKLTRRTALAGAVTLPAAMAPLGMAQAMATANATDGVWADHLAAMAQVRALDGLEGVTDEEFDAALDAYNPTFDAVLEAPVATMIDVERKLVAAKNYYRGSVIPHELLDDLFAQFRAATGRAVT